MNVNRIALMLAMVTGCGCLGSAATFTASGSGSDGALSAQAVITPGSGTVAITLTNLLGAETSIGQAISDISFSISGATGTASYTGGTANAISISSGGVTSTTPASPGTSGFGWALTTSGTMVTLEGAGGAHMGQPVDLIVGSGPYGANGNPGTGGFGPHNPSLQTSATFDLSLPGVTSASTISGVRFSFGTGPDTFLPGVPGGPSPVPEPASILLFGTVLAVSGKLFARRLQA